MPEVLINARAAARRQLSGVERWAVELAERLPQLRPGAYAVARPPRALAYQAGQAWEQAALPALARRLGADLILNPANLAPLAFAGNAVVVHDAVALTHPEWFSPAYVAWHRRVLPAVVRRARVVVTVSAFSRDEIAATTGVPAARIAVVPGGVDPRFSPEADPEPARRALGLRRPYVVTVAGEGARKNLAVLGATARALAARGIDVVAAGSRRAHHGPSTDVAGVRHLGYVDDALLPGLYAGARAFVLPSLHEGFGLPCLEAMASGVPVVASDAGALPETCGDAALLVEARRPDLVAEAVVAACEPATAARLREAGLARAGRFSWHRTAEQVDALLRTVATRPPAT
ncbi:MAG TPA: glycosyltransferase family 1 protein [Capillimicrobium sp.]|nr:glycosyltransferase family 1 protein [Capillimicrobium sp.]